MKDQVQHLRQKGIEAAAIYSGMHYREIDRILDNGVHGNLKLLYLSPERLQTDLALVRIKQMKVNLIAVDEAHCISQWGYDFRPPYLKIVEIRSHFPKTPVLALTATATTDVIVDIQEKLGFKEGQVFSKSFSRKNLAYVVLEEENKEKKLLDILKKVPGTSIIYARNRKKCKEIALRLIQSGIKADFYHAGLTHDERSAKQENWMQNKSTVMVCTNAFGMGIDKPDVRSVIHMDLPNNLEDYFQEAGRAGRDGKKSYVALLYNNGDKLSLEEAFRVSYPPLDVVKNVYRALGSYLQLAVGSGLGMSYDFDLTDFSKKFHFEALVALSAIKVLEQSGWITLSEAIYMPPTVQVIVERDVLYDFQLRNPQYEAVIQAVLRAHQGVFLHPIAVNEHKLAKHIRKDVGYVYRILAALDSHQLFRYIPQKDAPQITFIKERVEYSNLSIDVAAYNFRKNRAYERMKKAIQYAETARCRNVMLLEYFGEKAFPCGTCDVCLGRTKATINPGDYERYAAKIREILSSEACTSATLLEYFSPRTHQSVLSVLERMLEEELIAKHNDLYTLN